jgi:hypothetical protein
MVELKHKKANITNFYVHTVYLGTWRIVTQRPTYVVLLKALDFWEKKINETQKILESILRLLNVQRQRCRYVVG